MKKTLLGFIVSLGLGFGAIFAQNLSPDSAEIEVKSPVIQGEATNLRITMKKGGSDMRQFTGGINILITDENKTILRQNEYTLPSDGIYRFLPEDLGSKEFQKGLEIKKEGLFYIQVIDLNDKMGTVLGEQLIRVVKNGQSAGSYHIDVFNPEQNSILTNEKVEIIAQATDLPNSTILAYIDDIMVGSTLSDSVGQIIYTIPNIEYGKHTLRLESPNIEGAILGTSDKIQFSYAPISLEGLKSVEVNPEEGLRVGDLVDITVYTDEMIESVKISLSDRSENESMVLSKDGIGIFHQKVFLVANGEVNISVETSASNNITKKYENVKKFFVGAAPEVDNVKTQVNPQSQSAEVSREVKNGDASSFLIDYRAENSTLSGQEWTDTTKFTFNAVPYDTPILFTITPYWDNAKRHGSASKTIQFVISKANTNTGTSLSIGTVPYTPRCSIQNISTRTKKVGDSHYLVRDKVENVSKYIVYSSTTQSGTDKVKVYETTDTSYEYPFDRSSEEDQFAYFRIMGICDDGEELELSGATKVQVGPAENFFLLVCLTLLIYFGIKLFRETEA